MLNWGVKVIMLAGKSKLGKFAAFLDSSKVKCVMHMPRTNIVNIRKTKGRSYCSLGILFCKMATTYKNENYDFCVKLICTVCLGKTQ